MDFGVLVLAPAQNDNAYLLILVAVVAAASSFAVFLACFCWFRYDQRRLQRRLLQTIAQSTHNPNEIFVTGKDPAACGELVAQFKVKQGKQVVSVLEADGKRFIHVSGELSEPERAKMVRYLKSEGFMS